MDLDLKNRVVLVVGGTGLIGRAVAAQLRQEGAVVVTAARGGSADVVVDASDSASIDAAIATVLDQHGRLDGLVVTAAPSARTLDQSRNADPAQVADAFEAKSMTFLRLANAVIPHMRASGFGRIVGVSGQNALTTGNITGSIRNAALIIAAKNLADDLAGTGVAVNTVNPGTVTPTPSSTIEHGRPGESTPEQIADLVTFLTSPRAAVSGESIAVGHRIRGIVSF
ncbi:SDR family NAD(P)-dependent oxidoreductase [Glaciihabitans sp. dw_435]|uniref:SDR family NAD(P)-dependent oxidoreductase n=1 Tax=Glaciihabitans sp. dw_435 TaxID=2720081 RepID=UPI001BD6326D|nr:SDR family oxidoreductase [Glaciihabitans sp. dw_435]